MEKWKIYSIFSGIYKYLCSSHVLREKYSEAINEDGVVGLAIATRPDCLGEDVLDLIEEFSKKIYLWVELGLQTVNENTCKIINRGYNPWVCLRML